MLRILWELRAEPLTFRALQDRSGGISPSVLNARLSDLRDAALVENTDQGYALTPLARDLLRQFAPLVGWAEKWADQSKYKA